MIIYIFALLSALLITFLVYKFILKIPIIDNLGSFGLYIASITLICFVSIAFIFFTPEYKYIERSDKNLELMEANIDTIYKLKSAYKNDSIEGYLYTPLTKEDMENLSEEELLNVVTTTNKTAYYIKADRKSLIVNYNSKDISIPYNSTIYFQDSIVPFIRKYELDAMENIYMPTFVYPIIKDSLVVYLPTSLYETCFFVLDNYNYIYE